MQEIDVVFLSWAKDERLKQLTEQAIKTLLESEDDIKFNIFVVETNHEAEYERATTIHPDSSYGYNKYMNIGRRAGCAEFVCLCNNDITFEKNWAKNILDIFLKNSDVFSASPFCIQSHKQFGIIADSGLFFGHEVANHIVGCCIFQRRSIYELIGDLDERFIHWYADNDYAYTLSSKNIKHVLVTSSKIQHKVEGTIKNIGKSDNEFYQMTWAQKSILKQKWSS
jgi:GT2 family glycosyltransferase